MPCLIISGVTSFLVLPPCKNDKMTSLVEYIIKSLFLVDSVAYNLSLVWCSYLILVVQCCVM